MAQGTTISLAKYLFGELVGDFFYAPVWWYTRGFLKLLGVLRNRLANLERTLGLRIWIKTLGKPMYGQYDIAGKIISFIMRIVVLFARIVAFVLYALGILVMALAWLIVPVIVVWQIVANFVGLLTS